MNPKAEFVKAIMCVLRLEANIYTNGAIETIIERLEISDYQLFIAYLGERKADYEKPIENIAKGVDEFYNMKISPMIASASEKSHNIVGLIIAMVSSIKEKESLSNAEVINKLKEDPFVLTTIKMKKVGTNETATIAESDLQLIKQVGYDKFFDNIFEYNVEKWLKDSILKPFCKPSISEQIEDEAVKEASQSLCIESDTVKKLFLQMQQKKK